MPWNLLQLDHQQEQRGRNSIEMYCAAFLPAGTGIWSCCSRKSQTTTITSYNTIHAAISSADFKAIIVNKTKDKRVCMWHDPPISGKFQERQEFYLVFWDLWESQSSKIWTLIIQHWKIELINQNLRLRSNLSFSYMRGENMVYPYVLMSWESQSTSSCLILHHFFKQDSLHSTVIKKGYKKCFL